MTDDDDSQARDDVVVEQAAGDVEVAHRLATALVGGAVQVERFGGAADFGSPLLNSGEEVGRGIGGDVLLAEARSPPLRA